MNSIILIELIVYCGLMLGIGYYFSRKKMDQSDFLLGGKKLPGWALAFSERATGESSWLLLGLTGFVFVEGLSAIWVCIGIALGIVCAWLFLARRFMVETNKHNLLTIPDYLSIKFRTHAKLIRWTASLLIVSFFMFYLGAQFAGAGKTLFSTFGLDMTTAIILTAAIILAFFWKRTSGIGIVATIVTGFISTVIWISTPLEEMFTSRAATFIIAAAAGIVFSLLFPEKQNYSESEGVSV